MITHSDAYTKKRAMIDRSVCRDCGRANDRANLGSLGGVLCRTCWQDRRNVADRLRRDIRANAIAAAGGTVCKWCYKRAVEPDAKKCAECCERRAVLDDDTDPSKDGQGCKSTRQAAIVAEMTVRCARCHLRGPHECLEGQPRRSSWENTEGRL